MDKYQTFWRRFFAGLIDGIIFVPIGFIDYLLLDSSNMILLITGTTFSYSIFYIYTVYFHWSTGQTLGKKWMDIRVVDKSETKLLTFQQSFMRDSIYILLETTGLMVLIFQIIELGQYPIEDNIVRDYLEWLATIWFLLEIATMLINERRRAIHDMLAGSVVIKEEFWKSNGLQPPSGKANVITN